MGRFQPGAQRGLVTLLCSGQPPPSFLINRKCVTLHKPDKQVASLEDMSSSQRETWGKLRAQPR